MPKICTVINLASAYRTIHDVARSDLRWGLVCLFNRRFSLLQLIERCSRVVTLSEETGRNKGERGGVREKILSSCRTIASLQIV